MPVLKGPVAMNSNNLILYNCVERERCDDYMEDNRKGSRSKKIRVKEIRRRRTRAERMPIFMQKAGFGIGREWISEKK